jgi:hypothetical protein
LARSVNSTHEIARRLNQDGVPARGQKWHGMTVYRILKANEPGVMSDDCPPIFPERCSTPNGSHNWERFTNDAIHVYFRCRTCSAQVHVALHFANLFLLKNGSEKHADGRS